MAFLLLLHQKMSLQRKVNKLTLAQTSIGTRKDRITKRIEKVQKAYAKKQSKLEAQAKMMTSQCNNTVSMWSMQMANAYQAVTWMDVAANSLKGPELENFKAALKDGNKMKEFQERHGSEITTWTQQATTQNTQIGAMKQNYQSMFNTMQTSFSDNVSIWLEAQKQALEDEEQMALAPLEEEDTQIDLEQASNETQLTYAQSRLDNIKQALDKSAGEAPSFGA